MTDQRNVKKSINKLIDALQENKQFYTTAAQNVINDELRGLFQNRTQQRTEFMETLAEESPAGLPDEESILDWGQSIQRGFLTVKAAMTIERDETDITVIDDSKDADQRLLSQYESALQTDALSDSLRKTLEHQYSQIQAGQAYLNARFGKLDQTVLIALFSDVAEVEQAIDRLGEVGIQRSEIGLIGQKGVIEKETVPDVRRTTKESATAGAVGGGAVGGIIGLAAGVSTVLTMGPVLIAGIIPLSVGVTVAGATIGASYGGIFGTLIGWGVAGDSIQKIMKKVEEGQILLAVRINPNELMETEDLLRQAGGENVSVRQESFDEAFSENSRA